jgi:hypothetical protein
VKPKEKKNSPPAIFRRSPAENRWNPKFHAAIQEIDSIFRLRRRTKARKKARIDSIFKKKSDEKKLELSQFSENSIVHPGCILRNFDSRKFAPSVQTKSRNEIAAGLPVVNSFSFSGPRLGVPPALVKTFVALPRIFCSL